MKMLQHSRYPRCIQPGRKSRRPESATRNSEQWCFIDLPKKSVGVSRQSFATGCGRASNAIYLRAHHSSYRRECVVHHCAFRAIATRWLRKLSAPVGPYQVLRLSWTVLLTTPWLHN